MAFVEDVVSDSIMKSKPAAVLERYLTERSQNQMVMGPAVISGDTVGFLAAGTFLTKKPSPPSGGFLFPGSGAGCGKTVIMIRLTKLRGPGPCGY